MTSTPQAGPSIRRLAFGDLEQEFASTRRVLERVPDDRRDFRPHERSWTVGELAAHTVNILAWQMAILSEDEYDLAAPAPEREVPEDVEALLASFDARSTDFREALDDADDETLLAPWTLRKGEEVMFTMPRVAALRSMGVSHMVHHRGQLTVYLRLMDIAVPGPYGPSADEAHD